MKKQITKTNNTSIATIERSESDIAKGMISVDLHHTNSTSEQALYECYSDLLLSGTSSHSRDELLNAINALGASIDIHVNDGVLTVEITSIKKAWTKTLKLVKELLTNSTFSGKELTRVKKLAINALNDDKEDAKSQALDGLKSTLYPAGDRRSVHTIKAIQSAVKELTRQNVKGIHARLHERAWTASVTGEVSVCSSFTALVVELTKHQTTAEVATQIVTDYTKTNRLILKDIPSRQNIDISIGCVVPLKPGDAEYAALVFGVAVLAKWGGFAGRLMSTVRELEGLTYSIYGRIQGCSSNETGYLAIMTFFNPAQVKQGLESTFREITKIHTTGITKKEHDAFQTILETQTILRNDSPMSQIAVLHGFNRLGFTIKEMAEFEKAMSVVTRTEVNQAIKQYLDPTRLTISAAGPTKTMEKELKAMVNKL